MKKTDWIEIILIIVMAIVAILILVVYTGQINELGQSICKEEYGMDFESYIRGVLKCKEPKEQYDEIQIEIS